MFQSTSALLAAFSLDPPGGTPSLLGESVVISMHDRPPGFESYLNDAGWRRRWEKRHRDVDRIKNGQAYSRVYLAGLAPPDPIIDGIYMANRPWLLYYVAWRDYVYGLDRYLLA